MIVVDSAAVVDALTAVEGGEDLRPELATDELYAPRCWTLRSCPPWRGLTLSGQLSFARAQDALTDFDDLPIHRWPSGAALRWRA